MASRMMKMILLGGGEENIKTRILATERASLLAYLPMSDSVGSTAVRDYSGNGFDGTPTDITFESLGLGKGIKSGSFNGTTSKVIADQAGLLSAINMAEGTLLIATKLSAAFWSDNTRRYLFSVYRDSTNQVYCMKYTDNTLYFTYAGDGTYTEYNYTESSTDTLIYCVTWSKAADKFLVYKNGVLASTELTGLGTMTGNATVLNIGYLGTYFWSGLVGQFVLWSKPLTALQISGIHL